MRSFEKFIENYCVKSLRSGSLKTLEYTEYIAETLDARNGASVGAVRDPIGRLNRSAAGEDAVIPLQTVQSSTSPIEVNSDDSPLVDLTETRETNSTDVDTENLIANRLYNDQLLFLLSSIRSTKR